MSLMRHGSNRQAIPQDSNKLLKELAWKWKEEGDRQTGNFANHTTCALSTFSGFLNK
jgi:hypothetical protein